MEMLLAPDSVNTLCSNLLLWHQKTWYYDHLLASWNLTLISGECYLPCVVAKCEVI